MFDISVVISLSIGAAIAWNYDSDGPNKWSKEYPLCGGDHQSPIDIHKSKVMTFELDSIRLTNYKVPQKDMIMHNNGHTVQIDLPFGSKLGMTGGRLNGHYYLKQFHFHWGHNDHYGSEHRLENKSFPLEMHLVSSVNDIPLSEATNLTDNAIGVVSVLFEVSQKDNTKFSLITDRLQQIKEPEQQTKIPKLTIEDLLPINLLNFYSYDGSLTTPPCSKNVIWTILKTTLKISERQLKNFRRMMTNKHKLLRDNHRSPQRLRKRHVYDRKHNENEQTKNNLETQTATTTASATAAPASVFNNIHNFICNCH